MRAIEREEGGEEGERGETEGVFIYLFFRFIFWKTLNDAQTKIRGKFAPNGNGGDLDVDLEEYEAVKGEEEVLFYHFFIYFLFLYFK